MRIQLTKLSDLRHRLEITRSDGSQDSVDLESKTFIVHDFLHYAIESTAGLTQSFWGQLSRGKTFDDMAQMGRDNPVEQMVQHITTEDAETEAVVGIMTGIVQTNSSAESAIAGIDNLFSAQNRALPEWLTSEFITTIKEKMRRLLGEWKALPYNETMEIQFD